MGNELPLCMQYLQALSTPAIALLAVVIGGMQWRTAHQRAALDLFDRRYELYTNARGVIGEIVRDASVSTEVMFKFLRATDRAKFLFGAKVSDYFAAVYQLLNDHNHAETMMTADDDDRTRWVQKKYAAFSEIAKFYERTDALVQPYMRMHQKAPLF